MSDEIYDADRIEFDIDAFAAGSSGEAFSVRPPVPVEAVDADETDPTDASPVFKLLSKPVLPELKHDVRARLLMQSPTRIYFYWSAGSRAYQTLQNVVGNASDYQLVLRLLDLSNDTEQIFPIDAEGSWWFDVSPDTEYRAEVGFYSTSRPFVRLLFSNTLRTPRKSPSPHKSSEARWAVTTHAFAEVLDASGFEEDAVEIIHSETVNDVRPAFAAHVGLAESDLADIEAKELNDALRLLAAGSPLEDLRLKITAALYQLLQAHLNKLSGDEFRRKFSAADVTDESQTFSSVGGSLVNIPGRRYKPLSSINIK